LGVTLAEKIFEKRREIMGYTKSEDFISVRRQGGIDEVVIIDEDGGDRVTNFGNRRTRQIAKRHFVRCVNHYFNSHGVDGSGLSATIKPPRKEAQRLPRPSWSELG
jgi:hypothetical protein